MHSVQYDLVSGMTRSGIARSEVLRFITHTRGKSRGDTKREKRAATVTSPLFIAFAAQIFAVWVLENERHDWKIKERNETR